MPATNTNDPADDIGVVVVTFNSAADLPACLGALVAARGVRRIVVVDNASRDASREIARACHDARVELVGLNENTGFAGGCNRGFAALPDCEFVVSCNPDVVIERNTLARAVDALRGDPELGAIAPRLMRPDGRTVDSTGQVLSALSLEVCDRGYGQVVTSELLEPTDVLAPCGALAVFRRQALEDIAEAGGPWAESFFCFWEDLEIGWRLARAGWRSRSLPEAVATHRRGAGAAEGRGPLRWRRSAFLEACILSNRWVTLVRHLNTVDLLVRLPLLLVWDLGLVVLAAVRRPIVARHLGRRLPMVMAAWRSRRRGDVRPRLSNLP